MLKQKTLISTRRRVSRRGNAFFGYAIPKSAKRSLHVVQGTWFQSIYAYDLRGRWQTRRNSVPSLEMFILLSARFHRSVEWILPGEGKCLRPKGNRNQPNSLSTMEHGKVEIGAEIGKRRVGSISSERSGKALILPAGRGV